MWFIYSGDGERLLVNAAERTEKLNSGAWFNTPYEAKTKGETPVKPKNIKNENIKTLKPKKGE